METKIELEGRHFLVPAKDSPCALWQSYFDQLEAAVGTANARSLWLVTWAANGSDYCTTGADFNKWLQRKRIDVSNAATRAIADVNQIGSNVLGLGKNFTKVLSVGIPLVAGVGLLLVLYFLFRTAKNTDATDLLALRKGGLGK